MLCYLFFVLHMLTMSFIFIDEVPALLIGKVLAAGDLHIGIEQKFASKGVSFTNSTAKLARKLAAAYASSSADALVLLGDIKESIAWPSKPEYLELQKFFFAIRGINTSIVAGNHDGHLGELVRRMGYNIKVEKELIMGNVAFLHGNSLPSERAMLCDYLVEALGHIAVQLGDTIRKVFLMAGIGKKAGSLYEKFNKRAKLIVVPPLNDLILGNIINSSTKKHIPAFRAGIFNFEKAKIYTNKQLGKVEDFLEG